MRKVVFRGIFIPHYFVSCLAGTAADVDRPVMRSGHHGDAFGHAACMFFSEQIGVDVKFVKKHKSLCPCL